MLVYPIFRSLWLAPGGWERAIASMAGLASLQVVHLLLNGLTAEFGTLYLHDAQKKYEEELMAGCYDYMEAVRAYNKVNELAGKSPA